MAPPCHREHGRAETGVAISDQIKVVAITDCVDALWLQARTQTKGHQHSLLLQLLPTALSKNTGKPKTWILFK